MPQAESPKVSVRKAIRAVLVGAIVFMIALIYVPLTRVQPYANNASETSLGIAAVMAFLAYRFP
jgi:hypothetical protein